jgi:hypothetical protein
MTTGGTVPGVVATLAMALQVHGCAFGTRLGKVCTSTYTHRDVPQTFEEVNAP